MNDLRKTTLDAYHKACNTRSNCLAISLTYSDAYIASEKATRVAYNAYLSACKVWYAERSTKQE